MSENNLYVANDSSNTPILKGHFDDPRTIEFLNDGEIIVSVHVDTGKVTLKEGVSYDEASKRFWKCVEMNFKTRVSELEEEVDNLKDRIYEMGERM